MNCLFIKNERNSKHQISHPEIKNKNNYLSIVPLGNMFHSGFAALQCLSFWYPSLNDYRRKQKYQCIKKSFMISLDHDWPHSPHWWFLAGSLTQLTVLRAESYFKGFDQRLSPSWLLRPSWSSDSSKRKRNCKHMYVCFPQRKRLLS